MVLLLEAKKWWCLNPVWRIAVALLLGHPLYFFSGDLLNTSHELGRWSMSLGQQKVRATWNTHSACGSVSSGRQAFGPGMFHVYIMCSDYAGADERSVAVSCRCEH